MNDIYCSSCFKNSFPRRRVEILRARTLNKWESLFKTSFSASIYLCYQQRYRVVCALYFRSFEEGDCTNLSFDSRVWKRNEKHNDKR